MNEELKKLLKKINDTKNAVKSLAKEGKIEEAKAKKEELKALQEKFELLADLDDDEKTKMAGKVQKIDNKNDVKKAIVNIIKSKFFGVEPEKEDVDTYKNALTTTKAPEGERYGAGITIPDDVRVEIEELRRSNDNLEQYVNVEPVATLSGTRNVEEDAESTPFDNVDEAADFPEMDEPKFKQVNYRVKKKGGILKVTAELFEDTAYNIMAYIMRWIAKKTKATRNAMILKVLDEITAGKEVAVANLDSLKDITNTQLDPAIANGAVVLTNQDGFNYLDKMKDSEGKYILQPDPTSKTNKLLFGTYPVVVLSKKTLKSTKEESAMKYPVYIGDLKEAITLFDRKVISVELNDKAAGLWEKDMTGIKARDRFDVQAVDENAVVKGVITEAIAG